MKTRDAFCVAVLLAGLLGTGKCAAQSGKPAGPVYALYNHPTDQHSIVQPFLSHILPAGEETSAGAVIKPSVDVRDPRWTGCAALAVARNSRQFYLAEKHRAESGLWVQDSTGGQRLTTGDHRNLKHTFLAKMATGPDGHVYAMSTSLRGGQHSRGKALLIRFRNGKGAPEILGSLVSPEFDPNTIAYSGDIAFSAAGDLFIFGTEVDTVSHAYTGSHILRIPCGRLRQAAHQRQIPVEYIASITGMGTFSGMDSTIITGVAFDDKGQFILSATDKQTERQTYFYKGRIRYRETMVFAQPRPNGIPAGYVASDLASANFPAISILSAPSTTYPVAQEKSAVSWEQYVTIRNFQF